MKISVDDQELYTLTDIQKQVLHNEIPIEIFESDMKRRLKHILTHKYEQCFKRMKAEWDTKLLANGVESFPARPDEYAALVFSQPNYKNRSQRDAEAQPQ